jgi:hypothetical protein
MKEIYISPSDLAFLYEESKWGFHTKYISGIKRPPLILPKIFNIIDSSIKNKFIGENLSRIDKNLPNAKLIDSNDKWVVSKSIVNEEYPDICIKIRGKIDAALEYEDGSHAVVDFKTSEIHANYLQKYKNQLFAYCYGISNPENSKAFSLNNISKTGLLIFEPDDFHIDYNGRAGIKGNFKWLEFELDLNYFENFIRKELVPLLAGPEPKPEENDNYWAYLKQFGFEYQQE